MALDPRILASLSPGAQQAGMDMMGVNPMAQMSPEARPFSQLGAQNPQVMQGGDQSAIMKALQMMMSGGMGGMGGMGGQQQPQTPPLGQMLKGM